ncbi:MAG: VWA domain-containing protein, partial [Opitutales bacterium]
MTFEDPTWLHLSPALVLASAGLLALGFRRRSHLLARFAAPRLLEQLTERASLRRSFVKAALIVLAVAAISLALARPQYGVEWSQQKARGLDIVFALDSSKSMLATDLSPTRLDRAKLAILDLLTRLESDRIGLVAFAGQAFLQTPPTLDYAAFRESLEATGPSMLSRGGSDLGRALKEAAGAFPNENNVKVVLLLTDGEDLGGQALEAAEEAAEAGIQVFAIGVGTPEGTYLRVRNADGNEEFVRDNQGQPVRSQLDEATLQQIAQLTGGRYTRLNDGALDELYDSVLATLPREERESELKEVKIERFQWFLSAAICCLILERLIRRRNSRSAAARLLILAALGSASQTTPHTTEQSPELVPAGLHLLATAADHDDSTVDPAALAHEAMQNRDYAKALERYETAVRETADRMHQRDLLYNMGHAQHQIARQTYETGNLEQALVEMQRAEDYFKSAAEVDPHDDTTLEDAEKTAQIRKQIEQLLKQQQQEENQQKQNKPQDQQDEEENRQQDQ